MGNLHIAWERIGKSAGVTAALDVVLPPQRVDSRSRPSEHAAQQSQVAEGTDIVRAAGVLGNAHGVVDGRIGA